MHRLAALDVSQRAQAVAVDGRKLVILLFRRFGHQLAEPRLDVGRLPGEEVLRIVDQLAICLSLDPPDARRRAATDLVQQARPRPVLEETVRTAPQQEQLLQRIQRPRHRPGAGERPIILPLDPPRAAMLLHSRELVILTQQDEREAFVVPQQHVVGRPEALDQLRLQQQRLRLRPGSDDGHRPRLRDHPLQPLRQPRHLRIVGYTCLQRSRLADVEDVALGVLHPVHARPRRQGLQDVADRRHPRLQVGSVAAAHGVGRALLVESLRRPGVLRAVGGGPVHG